MREIKFRVWDSDFKKIVLCNDANFIDGRLIGMKGVNWDSKVVPMQYTGLKDKNGLTDIYEDDIIDIEGRVIGNKYQNNDLLKNTSNLLIQGFGTSAWEATNKKAMERGCKYSE